MSKVPQDSREWAAWRDHMGSHSLFFKIERFVNNLEKVRLHVPAVQIQRLKDLQSTELFSL